MGSNPILQSISQWFRRNFSDPDAISLSMVLVFGLLFLEFFGKTFMPILVSIVISYLLLGLVQWMVRHKIPYLLSVGIVYFLFLGIVVYVLTSLLPLLWSQLVNVVKEIPKVFNHGQVWLDGFLSSHPTLLSKQELSQFTATFNGHTTQFGQFILQKSFIIIPNMLQIFVYFILVPILVFFFVKDSRVIKAWFSNYLPNNRTLLSKVGVEVNEKIGCYVRGRVLEIVIVGVVSAISFSLLGLQYAVLLGALLGLSVLIPYVGAVIVTIPIVILGLMQWGFSSHFLYLMIVYAVITVFDAYILVPYLFSETMDLHPVVIILAVVVFGIVWGFWGVFFAIPLATLFNVVLKSWPRNQA